MTLFEYGILQEKSDIRAHVSVIGRCVYVFQTANAIKAIKTKKYPEAPAFTGSIKTANGLLVPPFDIDGIRVVDTPDDVMDLMNFNNTDSTSAKGNKAVEVVKHLLRRGLFPMNANPETIEDRQMQIIEDRQMQISGLDILVKMEVKIQVKCDWGAGVGPGCTGNLFLQIAESNPYSQH